MARSSRVADSVGLDRMLTGLIKGKQDPQLEIVHQPLSWFRPYGRNPRNNDKALDRMASSITEFGFAVPVLARSTGEVVDGHLRLKGAAKMNWPHPIPVVLCDSWTEAQVKAFRLMVNRSVSWADWDLDALALEFGELKAMEFNLSLTGFDSREIDSLTLQLNPAEDEVPPVPETPVTRPGDLWLLGSSDMRHRVYCGDATKPEDVARLMDGRKADLVVVDFPYNVDYKGKTKDSLTVQNDNMSDAEFYSFLLAAYRHLLEHTKPGGGIYVFHADTEGVNFRRGMVDAGWKLAQCCVWVKNSMVMGRQDYNWRHEPVLYGWKPGAAHRWLADRTQTTVWNFDRPTRSTAHPTIKPIALLSYAITNSSERGEIVLDTFLGSGSTLCASEQIGRICYGSEIDEKYVDVAVLRWQSFTGKQATLAGDGRTFGAIKSERLTGPAEDAINQEREEALFE